MGKEGGSDDHWLAQATLPACQAHCSWDWEELQVPKTPAEIQARGCPGFQSLSYDIKCFLNYCASARWPDLGSNLLTYLVSSPCLSFSCWMASWVVWASRNQDSSMVTRPCHVPHAPYTVTTHTAFHSSRQGVNINKHKEGCLSWKVFMTSWRWRKSLPGSPC